MTYENRKSDAPEHSIVAHPLGRLPAEDLDLIVELVLQSGSLKGLAEAYGVSYPTIRARLDRVIERLRGVVRGDSPDPMNELLARLVEQGQLTPPAARSLREQHRAAMESARRSGAPNGGSS